jgi:hypothetical protein
MIVTIMQPAYLPWLGFFERAYLSDILIVLDHVQLDTNSKTNFTNRNKIKTNQDNIWLTIPIKKKGKYGELYINKIEIDNELKWKQKHLGSIKQFYGKSPFFNMYFPSLEKLICDEHNFLHSFINQINKQLFELLSINTKVIYSSSMPEITSKKDELILDLCKSVGANKYISGPLGRDYIDVSKFRSNNIELLFHDYKHPDYKQQFDGFIAYLSVIDLLFNHGLDSLQILNTTKTIYDLSR